MTTLCTQLLHSNDIKKEEGKKEEEETLLSTTALQRHHTLIEGEGLGRCE
jgi:hypothetical protein